MSTALAPRLEVCPEYQGLLDSCQKMLAAWQQRRTMAERNSLMQQRARVELRRLQEEYARSYAALEGHEQGCRTCQYIAKVGGLDFESMSIALNGPHHTW
jgi:hypothetical protein